MATPTPMKHAPSSQGRTPSGMQHGAAATPPVSTPFSATHTAFSPHGPKSSPQHIKKSPATTSNLTGHPSNPPVNFDSPTAAALGALGIGNGMELGLDNVGVGGLGGLGHVERDDDDERAKRLHQILTMLKANKGRVSEAGLERLVKSIGLECLWASGVGNNPQKTLIIAGSALSIDIIIANNIVSQVALSFPGSASAVSRHADWAAQILLSDLKLRPDESPLTKKLDRFAVNLERLAGLDKLSVIPGFNCHEAIAGIYESLERLHAWDLARLRADPVMVGGRSEDFLAMMAMCARHGRPGMHRRGRVGMTLEYWTEQHLVALPVTASAVTCDEELTERTWGIWVGCAPNTVMGYPPARISSSWISDAIEKPEQMMEEDLLLGPAGAGQTMLDWQEPDNTILPQQADEDGHHKAAEDVFHQPAGRLPEVAFTAEFDPPITMPLHDWEQIHHITGSPAVPVEFSLATFDSLMFPIPPRIQHDPSEPRTIRRTRRVHVFEKGSTSFFPAVHVGEEEGHEEEPGVGTVTHKNTLFVYKPVYGRTLTSVPFSHPKQLVDMLPRLRQYAFLTTVLERSFGSASSSSSTSSPASNSGGGAPSTSGGGVTDGQAQRVRVGSTAAAVEGQQQPGTRTVATTSNRDDFAAFLSTRGGGKKSSSSGGGGAAADRGLPGSVLGPGPERGGHDGDNGGDDEDDPAGSLWIDVTLTAHPVPRLQVVFPFRKSTATVVLEVQLGGMVHVVSENVLAGRDDDDDDVGDVDDDSHGGSRSRAKGKGRELRPQDLAQLLHICEDLDVWCEWMRSRLQ